MSIKFYIPDYNNNNPKRASFRFRATIPLKGMRPEDGIISHIEEAKENDLVVLAKKSKPKDVHYLKERNIKCVYDICDNKWRKNVATNWVEKVIIPHNELCKHADALVTTCEGMREFIYDHTGRDSIIVNDPYEFEKTEPSFSFDNKITIFNFGNSKHFSRIKWNFLIDKLNDIGIDFEIHCMLDRVKKYIEEYQFTDKIYLHEYNYDKQKELMKACDVIFLPILAQTPEQFTDLKVKSPNRIIDSIQAGKPVITNISVQSYKPFKSYVDFAYPDFDGYVKTFKELLNRKKTQIIDSLKAGQEYIELNHSPKVIGKQWIELENKV